MFHSRIAFSVLSLIWSPDKSCVLTITRPGGPSRSYTTKAEFTRRNEAKARAATIAIEMGAVDFILYGDHEPNKKPTVLLVPLDPPVRNTSLGKDGAKSEGIEVDPTAAALLEAADAFIAQALPDGEKAVQEIEKCCEEWRAGRIRPMWVYTADTKTGTGPLESMLLVLIYPEHLLLSL